MKTTKLFYLGSASKHRQNALPLGFGFGLKIVGSQHVAPVGGELPPRYDSALQPSIRIHNSSLIRAISKMPIPIAALRVQRSQA
jgi:hypothetical protein